MKPTAKELKIIQRMQPGVITLSGFLGSDTRALNEIIADDAAQLNRLDKTAEEIAARMEYFTQKSWNSYLDGELVDGKYQVKTDVYRGKLPCPFGHIGVYRKALTTLTNTANGLSVTWTSLNTHMIGSHGFFEGEGSPFHLDPQILVRALFE